MTWYNGACSIFTAFLFLTVSLMGLVCSQRHLRYLKTVAIMQKIHCSVGIPLLSNSNLD